MDRLGTLRGCFFAFSVVHGLYFLFLGDHRVQNKNPKFYIKSTTRSRDSRPQHIDSDVNDLLQTGIITNEEYSLFRLRLDEANQKKQAKENERKIAEERNNALRKLKTLRDSGIMTDAEYSEKKSELMGKSVIIDRRKGLHGGWDDSDITWLLRIIGFLVIIIMLFNLIKR
jgi:hypothetical protein